MMRGIHAKSGIVLACVATLALLAAPPARAQITIGSGHKPSLAVDAAGTAYVAWFSDDFHSSLHFCRLARGAQTCAGAPTIVVGGRADTGTSLSRPFVSVAGATVRVVQHRYGFASGSWERVLRYTSRDGGDTWEAGAALAESAQSKFDVGLLDTATQLIAVLNGGGIPLQSPRSLRQRPTTRTANTTELAAGAQIELQSSRWEAEDTGPLVAGATYARPSGRCLIVAREATLKQGRHSYRFCVGDAELKRERYLAEATRLPNGDVILAGFVDRDQAST